MKAIVAFGGKVGTVKDIEVFLVELPLVVEHFDDDADYGTRRERKDNGVEELILASDDEVKEWAKWRYGGFEEGDNWEMRDL